MKSLSEDGHATELVVMEAVEARCDICSSFRVGERARSCTSLLYDPTETLGQRRRWPDHLCYSDFMQRSIEFWLSQAVGQITPAIKLWAECYPLPIGEAAARGLYTERGQSYPDELTKLLPFQGTQEAYWALRVAKKQALPGFYGEKNKAVLDMFGLKGPTALGTTARDFLWLGAFAYSLRGQDDMSLVRPMQDGEAWWRDFSWKKIQGRPRGSGHWESRNHFERELIRAGRELRAKGRIVTQEEVATLLQTDDRVLRRWLKDFGIDWREVKNKF